MRDIDQKKEEFNTVLKKYGMYFIYQEINITNEMCKVLYDKLNESSNVQWDVIISTIALRLELCSTYDEAKELIKDVTGADVDNMITTIIPPNLRLN